MAFLAVGLGACGRTSEAPSEVAAGSTVPASLKIGTFNIKRLGHGSGRDMDRVVKLIDDTDFHVFAAVEVMEREAAEDLRARIAQKTGKPWGMLLSKTASGEGSYKEFFAFYYRTDLIKAEKPGTAFCDSTEGVEDEGSGCFAKDHGDADGPRFERDPFVGHFRVGAVDFVLVAVHLFYGDSDAASVVKRKRELAGLRKVMEKARTKTPGADVIALGDFNLALRTTSGDGEGPKMPPEFFTESPVIKGLVDGPTTIGYSSYDHLLHFEANARQFKAGSDKVVTDFTLSNDTAREKYDEEVSDHFPVGASLQL